MLARADAPLFFRELDPGGVADELSTDVDAVLGQPPSILHVLATDAHTGGGKSRPADVGSGDVPWQDLIAALRDADFTGWITAPDPSTATRVREWVI